MKRGNCNNLEELSDRMLAQAALAAALRAETRDELFAVLACVGLAVLSVLAIVNY